MKSKPDYAKWILAAIMVLFTGLAVLFGCTPQIIVEKRNVTFMNGDEVFEVQEVELGQKYAFPSKTPEREQPDDEHLYEFLGWTLDPNFYEYRSEILEEPDYVVADVTIYAAFRKVVISNTEDGGSNLVYNVEFRMPRGDDFGEWSGKTLSQFTQQVKRYQSAQIPPQSQMPQITGYHFTGNWEGGTLTDIRGHRRVTAVYEKNVYNYVWHYLDRTSSKSVEYREPIDLTQTPQTESVFVFGGWFMDEDLTVPATLSEAPASDLHLYAKYNIDFSAASVLTEGAMVYGDALNKLYVSGLADCEGLVYTFEWKVNGVVGQVTDNSKYPLKDAGVYNVGLHIYADYLNGVLLDEGDAKDINQSTELQFVLNKAKLSSQISIPQTQVVYGDPVPVPQISYSGFVFGETAQSVGVTQKFVYMQGQTDMEGKRFHAGEYSIITVPAELANYEFEQIDTPVFSVTQKDLDVTFAVQSYTYGDLFAPKIEFDGFEYDDGEAVLGEHWFMLTSASDEAGAKHGEGDLLHAGEYTAALKGYASGDYNVRLPQSSSFTVARRSAGASLSAVGGIYGDIPQISYTLNNVLPADEERFVNPEYTYTLGGGAYRPENREGFGLRFVAGDYSVNASFTEKGAQDYLPVSVTGATFNIAKKTVGVKAVVNSSYEYGMAVSPQISYGEDFAFGETSSTAGVEGRPVYVYKTASDGQIYGSTRYAADKYTVEIGQNSITSRNYEFVSDQTSFEVTPKELVLTVHLQSNTILYGQKPAPARGYINGISYSEFAYDEAASSVFAELPQIIYLKGDEPVADEFHADVYTATVKTEARNYKITVQNALLTVTPRTLFVGIELSAPSLVYGAKPMAAIIYQKEGYNGFYGDEQTQYTQNAYVEYKGKTTYTQAELNKASCKMAAGDYTLCVKGIGDLRDYTVTYAHEQAAIAFTMLRKPLTVTATANGFTYGDKDIPEPSFAGEGFAYGETEKVLSGVPAYSYLREGRPYSAEHFDAGQYAVSVEGLSSPNYDITFAQGEQFTVAKRNASLSVTAQGATYGQSPELSYSVSGVLDRDTAGFEFEYLFTFSHTGSGYAAYNPQDYTYFQAGRYTVTVNYVQNPNYVLKTDTKSFNISAKQLNIQIQNVFGQYVYGAKPAPVLSITGYAEGEDETVFSAKPSAVFEYSKTSAPQTVIQTQKIHVGEYYISAARGYSAQNYTFLYPQRATFEVTPKPVTVSVSAADIIYGQTPSPQITYGELAYDEQPSVLGTPTYKYAGGSMQGGLYCAGEYTLNIEGLASTDYKITLIGCAFNVAKRPASVEITAHGCVYGQTPELSYKSNNVLPADEEGFAFTQKISFARTGDGYADYNPADYNLYQAGNYSVTVEYVQNPNYNLTVSAKTFTVEKRSASVQITADGCTYGDEPNLNFEPQNVLQDDVAGFAFTQKITFARDGEDYSEYNPQAYAHYQAGEYGYTVEYVQNPNYDLAVTAKTFTVEKRSASVQITAEGCTYGDEPNLGFAPLNVLQEDVAGFAFTQKITFARGGEDYSEYYPQAYAHYQAGNYGYTVEFVQNPNYNLAVEGKNFAVSPKELFVDVQNVNGSYVYGQTPAPKLVITGFASGESEQTEDIFTARPMSQIVYTGDSEEITHFDAGSYTVSAAQGYAANNYTFKYGTAKPFTVEPKAFTVMVSVANITYGEEPAPALVYPANPFEYGETAQTLGLPEYSYTGDRSQSGHLHAGAHTLTVSENWSNYNVTFKYSNSEFTVSPVNIGLTVNSGWANYAEDRPFEESAQNYWYAVSGDIIGSELTFGLEITHNGRPYRHGDDTYYPWGEYNVKVTFNVNGDYSVQYGGAEQKTGVVEVPFNVNKLSVTLSYKGNSPWSMRESWQQTPYCNVDAQKFTFNGTLALKDAADLVVDTYTQFQNFTWVGKPSITLKNGDDVTDNFEFIYDISLALNSSSFSFTKPTAEFVYDKQPHAFGLAEVSAAGVDEGDIDITYSTDKNGEYTKTVPQFTQAGEYTVWFKITAPNCDPADDSYAVKCSPATLTLNYGGINAVYSGGNLFEDIKPMVSGLYQGDEITSVKYSMAQKDISNSDALTLVNVSDSGAVSYTVDAGTNYNKLFGEYTVKISPAQITVTSWPATINDVYNAADRFTAPEYSVVEGNPVTVTYKKQGGEYSEQLPKHINVSDSGAYFYRIDAGQNYIPVERSYTVNITPAALTVTLPAQLVFDYDLQDHFAAVTLSGVMGEDSLNVEYSKDGGTWGEAWQIINVYDENTVNYRVVAGENTDINNYLFQNGNGSYTLTVNKARLLVKGPEDIVATYDKTDRFAQIFEEAVEGRLNGEPVTVTYSSKQEGEYGQAWQIINVADSCTVYYKVTAGQNYTEAAGKYTVTINKATVTIPQIDSATYSGETQTAQIEGTELFTVIANEGGINANAEGYDVVIGLADAANYKWSDGREAYSITLKFVITRAQLSRPTECVTTFTYNGGEQIYTPDGNLDHITVTGNAKTDAGVYYVKVELADKTNYEWTDGDQADFTLPFTINRAKITVNLPAELVSEYNAADHFAAVTLSGVMGEDSLNVEYSKDNNTWGGAWAIVNVYDENTVNYRIVAGENTNIDNYLFENGSNSGSYTLTINRARATIDTSGVKTDYTYNGAEQKVEQGAIARGVGQDTNGLGQISYSNNTFKDVPEGGKKVVTVTLSEGANYLRAETTVEITIAQFVPKIEIKEEAVGDVQTDREANTLELTYDSSSRVEDIVKNISVNETAPDNGWSTLYKVEKVPAAASVRLIDGADEGWVDNIGDLQIKDAGSYKLFIRITSKDGNNYADTEVQFTVTVAKAKITVNVPAGDALIYEYNAADHFVKVTLDGVKEGDALNAEYSKDGDAWGGAWQIVNVYDENTVNYRIVAGENTNIDNYLFENGSNSGSYTLTINKAKATIDVSGVKTDYTYSGAEQKIEQGAIARGVGQDTNGLGQITYSNNTFTAVPQNHPGESYGTFKITVTLGEGQNYLGAETTVEITVNKAQAAIDTDGVKTVYTYNGQNQTVEGATAKGVGADTNGLGDISYSNNTFTAVPQNHPGENYGTFEITVTLSEGQNYLGSEKTVEITVNKAQATIDTSNVKTDYAYTGAEQKVEQGAIAKGVDGDTDGLGQISYSNNTFKDVPEGGKKAVTVTLGMGKNYLGAEKTVEITVARAQVTVNVPAGDTLVSEYNAADHFAKVTLSGTKGEDILIVKYSKNTYDWFDELSIVNVADSGLVYYKVTAGENTVFGNYQFQNGSDSGSYLFTVTQAKLDKLPDGANPPEIGEVIRRKGQTLDKVCKLGDNWQWAEDADIGSELLNDSYEVTVIYTDPSGNYEPYEYHINFTTRKERVTVELKENAAFATEFGVECDDGNALGQLFAIKGEDREITSEAVEYSKFSAKLGGLEDGYQNTGTTYIGILTVTVQDDDYFEVITKNLTFNNIVVKVTSVELNGTSYTIEDALNAAQSSQTITVKNNTAFASEEIAKVAGYYSGETPVESYYTVKENVILFVPCDTKNATIISEDAESKKHQELFNGNGLYCKLIITNQLIVNGKFHINGARVNNGNDTARTDKNEGYAEVEIKANAIVTLNFGSEFVCYGYIYGEGTINALAGSTVKEPFAMSGYKGGTISSRQYTKVFPFNQYTLANIICHIYLQQGSLYNVQAAISGRVFVSTEYFDRQLQFIGNSKDYFVEIVGSGSYIDKYVDTNGYIHLETHGDINFHNLSINAMGITMSTSNLQVPIPGHFKLKIASGKATVPDGVSLKLLPGASLEVASNTQLDIFGSLYGYGDNSHIVYNQGLTKWQDGNYGMVYPYKATINAAYRTTPELSYDVTTPAKFIVTGKVMVKGILATDISGVDGGEVIFSGDTSGTITEDFDDYDNKKGTQGGIFTSTITCHFMHGDGTFLKAEKGYYSYTDEKWSVDSGSQTYNIIYKYVLTDTVSEIEIENSNQTTFTIMDVVELTDVQYSGWVFMGWYTQETCNAESRIYKIEGSLQDDITVYGLFKQVNNYIFEYQNTQSEVISPDTVLESDLESFNPLVLHSDKFVAYETDATKQKYFDGWYLDEDCTILFNVEKVSEMYEAGINVRVNVYAKWQNKSTLSLQISNGTATILGKQYDVSKTLYYKNGIHIEIVATFVGEQNKFTVNPTPDDCAINGTSMTFTMPATKVAVTIEGKGSGSTPCLVEGTLVWMADGTTKKVEDIAVGDQVLFYNHYTGNYETGTILYNAHLNSQSSNVNVINLKFANGAVIRIAEDHGLFDLDLNRYVFINEHNFKDFVGHRFATAQNSANGYSVSSTVLVEATITSENVRYFSPMTSHQFNLVAEGLLTITTFKVDGSADGMRGFVNYFEYETDSLKYKMQSDIEKYGLYTYDDFKDYITEEMFQIMDLKYLKVSVGKGLLTWDEIITALNFILYSGEM